MCMPIGKQASRQAANSYAGRQACRQAPNIQARTSLGGGRWGSTAGMTASMPPSSKKMRQLACGRWDRDAAGGIMGPQVGS